MKTGKKTGRSEWFAGLNFKKKKKLVIQNSFRPTQKMQGRKKKQNQADCGSH
jgi:hypothetical protein